MSGFTRRIEPSSATAWPAGRRKAWARTAPPCEVAADVAPGSPHGLTGLPSWPQSAQLNDAPSPEDTYSWPSGPNSIEPVECDGYCWHQSSINTVSMPVLETGAADR